MQQTGVSGSAVIVVGSLTPPKNKTENGPARPVDVDERRGRPPLLDLVEGFAGGVDFFVGD